MAVAGVELKVGLSILVASFEAEGINLISA